MKTLSGIAVVPGVVIGKALLYREDAPEIPRYAVARDETAAELERLAEAVRASAEELRQLKENAGGLDRDQDAIFTAHLLMIEDPDIHYQIRARLESRFENIEWIVWEVSRELSRKLAESGSAYLRERAADVADVSRRIINRLLGVSRVSLAELSRDVTLVARALLPSDLLTMNRERVKAIVMDSGSSTCHTAILARSFGIPSVLGLSTATKEISDGETIVVDGTEGKVYLDVDAAALEKYREAVEHRDRGSGVFAGLAALPAETMDGFRVVLNANIGSPDEAESLASSGAEGIGLYRSEFLFLTPGKAAEEDQYQAYRRVVRAMGGKPVTIRTVDIGGDKLLPGFRRQEEANPLLGWRAIRFSLSLPEMFKTQLRAILRSSVEGPVKILFPMISGIEELDEALQLLDEVKDECRRKGQPFADHIEAGAMIEVPAAAMTADILAEKAAFFSIGTNDLIQYSLAVDRGNEKVNYLAQPAHPAVLRFLKRTIDAAHKRGIKAAMCGELAGDPLMTPFLLGLGLDEFSMTSRSIPLVKQVIRSVTLTDCKALAEEALALAGYKQVNALFQDWRQRYTPDL